MHINYLCLSVYTLICNYKLLHERKKRDIYTIYTYRYITPYTFENVQKGIQGLHAWVKLTVNQQLIRAYL